jgi:protein-L-isoaspartate(D-aspartate) O-methyltransferase
MDSCPYAEERLAMVRDQIERRGMKQPRLLDAFRTVPRHCFVPENLLYLAYSDGPLPIGNGQTISQPYIVALMTSLAELEGSENVLEVGTGSGYQAAILAQLAQTVHSVERIAQLSQNAASILSKLGYGNIHLHIGDGSAGWPQSAPYQAILVTAAAPQPPPPLLAQLAEGGRLVIPAGERRAQNLEVWQRQGMHYECESIIPVSFVPLRGEYGWKEELWSEYPF